jgi:hypothetical protein
MKQSPQVPSLAQGHFPANPFYDSRIIRPSDAVWSSYKNIFKTPKNKQHVAV